MNRFKKILCIVDTESPDNTVIERAVTLAENNQAELCISAVVPEIPTAIEQKQAERYDQTIQTVVNRESEQRLNNLITPYQGRIKIHTKILAGTPFLQIIRAVLRDGYDLVFKSPDNPDWLDRFFSSDDMHLLRKCPCPVWMVKQNEPSEYRRILAAVDIDTNNSAVEIKVRDALNEQILEIASSLSLSEFTELHVVHVWDAVGESALRSSAFMTRPTSEVDAYVNDTHLQHKQTLDALMQKMLNKFGKEKYGYINPKMHLIKGWARKEIPMLAKQLKVDLVVMGTVARTGVPGLIMGNTAEAILDQLNCSVLAIKPPGFVSPVTIKH